jgi:carbonic anhydrase/acetyltransferase-like protein (isoleucine patch superfamily)
VPIYALGDLEPSIHQEAYVHPDATVIGDVRIGAFASVWPQAVLRGDYGRIEIGARTSVQDGTVIHCTEFTPSVIGANCVIGHNVHIEGATVGDHCLIASGSVLLNGSVVEDGAVLGAGGVVSFNGAHPGPVDGPWRTGENPRELSGSRARLRGDRRSLRHEHRGIPRQTPQAGLTGPTE